MLFRPPGVFLPSGMARSITPSLLLLLYTQPVETSVTCSGGLNSNHRVIGMTFVSFTLLLRRFSALCRGVPLINLQCICHGKGDTRDRWTSYRTANFSACIIVSLPCHTEPAFFLEYVHIGIGVFHNARAERISTPTGVSATE
ncbi:hypothetical protein K440DRAFT_628462 [Wilcoxina mikolae CBS 423.85]|nr:hypothetical protein K440DRAFT_628462 [Wilcoxina mikolae CBS 423.85]